MMVDSHAHAHFHAYKDDMDEVLRRSLEKGTVVNLVGTQLETSKRAITVAAQYDNVYATIGYHPEHLFSNFVDANEVSPDEGKSEFNLSEFEKIVTNEKVVAIGECGLDLYRLPETVSRAEALQKQTEVFLAQVSLAKKNNLPLVIHCRDAHDELIEVLKRPEAKGIIGTIHCYTSNWQHAEQYVALGYYIGFTGVITFPPQKKNPALQTELLEVVKRLPLEKILVETDCPYLSPVPYRGKRGEPWMVEETAKKIAEIRGVTASEVLDATTRNAFALFTKMKKTA